MIWNYIACVLAGSAVTSLAWSWLFRQRVNAISKQWRTLAFDAVQRGIDASERFDAAVRRIQEWHG